MVVIGITVRFKDDREDRYFQGSRYHQLSVEYKEAFAIIQDGSEKAYAFPAADIEEIQTNSL